VILTALNQYYDRLASENDPDSGRPKVPAYGFSEQKIGSVLLISREGELLDVFPYEDASGKKTVPKQMAVPQPVIRTSGPKSNFLWDKSAYVLGVQSNPDKKTAKEQPWVESNETFEVFKQAHIELLDKVEDDGLQAFLKFLRTWDPKQFELLPRHSELLAWNIVFQFECDDRRYLHDRELSKETWLKHLSESNDAVLGTCLVSGKREKIARLHPAIKGVYGGQSSGGSIVSFNADSYESYGKSQGNNAPVSDLSAFKYTTALNYLLNRNHRRCFSVGDASTVFWAETDNKEQCEFAEQLFMQTVNPTDDSEAAQIRPLVEQVASGRALNLVAPNIDPKTKFYILGLAPNASRLSIRYWLDTTFGELGENIHQHYTDLSLSPLPWKSPPSIWQLLVQLVPYRSGKAPKSDEVPAHLAGELMRSIITGSAYPRSILTQILLRIRSDGRISGLRVAMMKAVLSRDQFNKEDVSMSLDEYSENEGYQLGRLFAVLEKIQSIAIPGANATIADRYFGSASTVPYSVFPRLLSGSKNHLSKIRKKKPGLAIHYEKELSSIIDKIPTEYPKHFSIDSQGRFGIGYYHQREYQFSKPNTENSNNNDQAS
tara:strand:+ start:25694 stop:27499 length:1806 start_codon:yes stop_codon:yes gene_type:complete